MAADKQSGDRHAPVAQDTTVLMRTTRSGAARRLTAGENVVCGAMAGLVSRAVVSPFDVVKITLQLQTTQTQTQRQRGGAIRCLRSIVHKEGVRGLFKGNVSAELLYLGYGAAQFLAFGALESALARTGVLPSKSRTFVCGALAGGIATSATYPLDLLRTRFVAQGIGAASRVHKSIAGAVVQILRDDGPRGLYRGLWPACLQIMPYMGIMFASYDVLGSAYKRMRATVVTSHGVVARTVDSMQDALIGGSAAVVSKCCVYPLDLARKRLQIQGPRLSSYAQGAVPRYTGLANALVSIVRSEGPRALFRGLTPSLIKAAPASATVFFVYGQTRDLVLSLRSE
ncbi:mitochondrial thiamine pyrophosphate transporter [Coemansia sp. Benny D160-2]|nr:mitochondrial thiamine pyrophosphate transporter [Coemansia sp. Benny D160-2]